MEFPAFLVKQLYRCESVVMKDMLMMMMMRLVGCCECKIQMLNNSENRKRKGKVDVWI